MNGGRPDAELLPLSLQVLKADPNDPLAGQYLEELFQSRPQAAVRLLAAQPNPPWEHVLRNLWRTDLEPLRAVAPYLFREGSPALWQAALARGIADPDRGVRTAAILTALEPAAPLSAKRFLPALLDLLADPAAPVDLGRVLAQLKERRWDVLPALEAVLQDSAAPLARRRLAAILASRFPLGGRELAAALRQTCRAKQRTLRRAAADSLHRLGDRDPVALPAHVETARDSRLDATARMSALFALQSFGSDARAHAPQLLPLLADPDPQIADSALYALVEIGLPPESREALRKRFGREPAGRRAVQLATRVARDSLTLKQTLDWLRATNSQELTFALAPFGAAARDPLVAVAADAKAKPAHRQHAMRALLQLFPIDPKTAAAHASIAENPFSTVGRLAACIAARDDESARLVVPVLTQAALEGDPEVREEVIAAFEFLGQRAKDEADKLAEGTEPATALAILQHIEAPSALVKRILGKLPSMAAGDPKALQFVHRGRRLLRRKPWRQHAGPRLVSLLNGDDRIAMLFAIDLLREFPEGDGTAELVKRLETLLKPEATPGDMADERLVRWRAATALAQVRPASLARVEFLLTPFASGNQDQFPEAVTAIAALGKHATELVPELVRHVVEEGPAAAPAWEALLKLGPHAAPAAQPLEKHFRADNQWESLARLAEAIGPGAKNLAPRFEAALADPERAVRAAVALMAVGAPSSAEQAVEKWRKDRFQRHDAVAAYRRSKHATAWTARIVAAVEDAHAVVREQLALAIAERGAAAAGSESALRSWLSQPDPRLRRAAVQALGAIGGKANPETRAALVQSAEREGSEGPALEALARLDAAAATLTPLLEKALRSPRSAVRQHALQALALRPELRPQLAEAIVAQFDDRLLADLAAPLFAKWPAATAERAVDLLKARFQAARDPQLAAAIAAALARLGPAAKSARDLLQDRKKTLSYVYAARIEEALLQLNAAGDTAR